MKSNISKIISRIAFAALAVFSLSTMTSCESIEEVPPMVDSSTKKYKIPDPEPMTSSDVAAYNAIKDEYNKSTNSNL